MNYVLDTNIILFFLKDKNRRKQIEVDYQFENPATNLLLSIVTLGEIQSLALRNNWGEKKLERLRTLLDEFIIIDIRFQPILDAYAEIDTFSQGKHKSKKLGMTARNMGKNDLWIAATAFITKAKLITTDKDFRHLKTTFLNVEWIDLES